VNAARMLDGYRGEWRDADGRTICERRLAIVSAIIDWGWELRRFVLVARFRRGR
jgi:hypothetical protein